MENFEQVGGFDFTNFKRNKLLFNEGFKFPNSVKTGTTICGIIFKDGVVLGADTRATSGSIIADKNCQKIHYIAPNIYCCGAGTAADTENVTSLISSNLTLLRYETGKQSRVCTAKTMLKRHLFQYMGYVSAALVLGGCDLNGPSLHLIFPHGSTDDLPYCSMGSGSVAAIAMLEKGYKKDLEEKDAVNLVHEAICGGIFNDLGSGSNVDICIIRKDNVNFIRGYDTSNVRKYKRNYSCPIGTTKVLKEKILEIKKKLIIEEVLKDEDEEDVKMK